MQLLDELLKLQQSIQQSGEYVGSTSTRTDIANFYKNQWLPICQEFKNKFGYNSYQIVEENARVMYELSKSSRPSKFKLLATIGPIVDVFDRIEIDQIREQGSSFKTLSTPEKERFC